MHSRNKICLCDINHNNPTIYPSVTAACRALEWKITQRSHVCRILKKSEGHPAYYSGYVWAYAQHTPTEPLFPTGKIIENTPYILLPTGEMYTSSTNPYTLKTSRTTAEGRISAGLTAASGDHFHRRNRLDCAETRRGDRRSGTAGGSATAVAARRSRAKAECHRHR